MELVKVGSTQASWATSQDAAGRMYADSRNTDGRKPRLLLHTGQAHIHWWEDRGLMVVVRGGRRLGSIKAPCRPGAGLDER